VFENAILTVLLEFTFFEFTFLLEFTAAVVLVLGLYQVMTRGMLPILANNVPFGTQKRIPFWLEKGIVTLIFKQTTFRALQQFYLFVLQKYPSKSMSIIR
jgi:hypothetical protein